MAWLVAGRAQVTSLLTLQRSQVCVQGGWEMLGKVGMLLSPSAAGH